MLAREQNGLSLRDDPAALAPETIIVFELTGTTADFSRALRQVPGLQLLSEEEGEFDDPDEDEANGALYLTVPDAQALHEILRLWDLHKADRPLGPNHASWASVFRCLHDLRRWGPRDRVTDEAAALLLDLIDGEDIRIEIELVSRGSAAARNTTAQTVGAIVQGLGGQVVRTASIPEIGYEAILARLPAPAVRSVALREAGSLAEQPDVFAIRPQSFADNLHVSDADPDARVAPDPRGEPIVAILDAVPLSNHPLLRGRLTVFDPDDLSAMSVGRREHGTAMSSLVIWGDLQAGEPPLERPIFFRPVMYASVEHDDERFPDDRLVVDDVVRAVREMFVARPPEVAAAPSVLVVSISMGDATRPFAGRMSPWARAIDWLSFEYGVLFLVSAGNVRDLHFPDVESEDHFRALVGDARTSTSLAAMRDALPHRRIISPAEATNALTVGAAHHDALEIAETVANSHDALPSGRFPSPASRHGPGFRNAVKPDLLAPGGRLRGRSSPIDSPTVLRYSNANSLGGLKVAGSEPEMSAWSGFTSGATALTARASHQIYDALVDAYGEVFTNLHRARQALILKALLVHRATVPPESRELIHQVFGPADARLHQRRSANVRRLFGYGFPDWSEATACLASRATLWGHGTLGVDEGRSFVLPIPAALFGNRTVRRVTATLAWFTPIDIGRRTYKAVRLQIEEPDLNPLIGVTPQSGQTAKVAAARGTTFHRCWEGATARALVENAAVPIVVSRRPDNADDLPDAVPFGLAVTIESDGEIEVYDAVRSRLAVQPRVPARVTV
ncbi:S8 family peptidase [Brevundimonas intermedia]|uniref:S8 family peptidase n=1 Tax=Brevundimonas intermedia TaxID=74315 RepID=UPI0022F27200|nr:S8 family peptidase [Brevundimonas intermedia]